MISTIYEPKGRAREYAPLALNLHTGCPHQCGYCYVRTMRGQPAEATLRPGVLEALPAAVARLRGDRREVLLSFLSDPYPYGQPAPHTREALRILLEGGLRVAILSKGGTAMLADMDLLVKHKDQVRIGASLTCWSEAMRQKWEPGAAPIRERIEALAMAHVRGIGTFASCEPILDCAETNLAILASSSSCAVDEYRIGWVNYTQVRPDPRLLPLIVERAKALGSVGIKRDAWAVLERIGRTDAADGCRRLWEV